MSKYQRLLKNVLAYPALGSPRLTRIDGKYYWSASVWLNERQQIFTMPFEDVNIANDEARRMIIEIKKEGVR